MKKILKIIPLMITIVLLMTISSLATDFSVKTEMEKQGENYILKMSLDEVDFAGAGMNVIIFDLEYDQEIFELVQEEDITMKNGWSDLTYNEQNGMILLIREDFTKNSGEEIVEIKLTPKENAKSGETQIKITDIQATNSQNDLEASEQIINLKIDGKSSIIKNILIVIVVALLILLALRIFIRKQTKRRRKR